MDGYLRCGLSCDRNGAVMTALLAIALILAVAVWWFGWYAVLYAIGIVFLSAGAVVAFVCLWLIIEEGR